MGLQPEEGLEGSHRGAAPFESEGVLVSDGQPVITPGTEIIVDGIQFRATESFFVAKPDLTGIDRLWDGSADLILLSCRPRPGGAVENLVVVAERVPVEKQSPRSY